MNKAFSHTPDFLGSFVSLDQLPKDDLPEIAFVGRSNVGKSSLINALFNNKNVARTSNTPGRTQQLNFFQIEKKLTFVDLPGYGFAKASKTAIRDWTRLVDAYLISREALRCVYLLVDARHGLKRSDEEMMSNLDQAGVSYQIVLTKIDKVKEGALADVLGATQKDLRQHAAARQRVLLTSAEKRRGLDELRDDILSFF